MLVEEIDTSLIYLITHYMPTCVAVFLHFHAFQVVAPVLFKASGRGAWEIRLFGNVDRIDSIL